MSVSLQSSEELFEQLVQALLDERMTAEEFNIDAMPFARMEQLGHGLGKQLARRIQQALAERQGARMNAQAGEQYNCPGCGRSCRAAPNSRTLHTLDGEVEFAEPRCFCKSCRKVFFPSA
jgi:hypothetical protein